MFDRFLSTLSIVSRIPVKARFKFDPSRADFYLPITGLCPALLGFLVFLVFSSFFDAPLITAILVIMVQDLCFNLFHLDGLMDTADAFLGTVDREKRLAILKDSRVGVYGFFAGFINLSLKIALLCAFFSSSPGLPALVFAYPLCGRFAAALVPCMTGPVSPGGLGALTRDAKVFRSVLGFLISLVLWALLASGLLYLAAMIIPGSGYAGFLGGLGFWSQGDVFSAVFLAVSLLLAGPLCALFYARVYGKSLGGYTGDALGAAVETAEILYLMAVYIVLLRR
jgi:adenosylcobinamide-GDP ribazoletransferase